MVGIRRGVAEARRCVCGASRGDDAEQREAGQGEEPGGEVLAVGLWGITETVAGGHEGKIAVLAGGNPMDSR